MSENKQLKTIKTVVKDPRGGKRSGAGRPKGSTNKVSTAQSVTDFVKRSGQNFAEFGHQWMLDLKAEGNIDQALKLYAILHKYHLDDEPQKVDVTSNGENIVTAFQFVSAELPEWKNE
jgi:hypothetical protein